MDARRRPAFQQRALDVDPLHGHAPPLVGVAADPVDPASLVVVIGVERAEVQEFALFKVGDDLKLSRRVGREVEIGEQALDLEVRGVELQPGRAPGGLVGRRRDADPVPASGPDAPLTQDAGRVVAEDHDGVGLHEEALPAGLLEVVLDAFLVVVAEPTVHALGPAAEVERGRDRGVGGFQVLLHVKHREPQALGDVVEAVRRGVFREEVLQRDVDREQVVKRVLVFDPIEAAEHHAALGLLPGEVRLTQAGAERVEKRPPRGAAWAPLGGGRHLPGVDLVKDLDPLFERLQVVWLPGACGCEIEAPFVRLGVVANETMLREEFPTARSEVGRAGRRRQREHDRQGQGPTAYEPFQTDQGGHRIHERRVGFDDVES